MRRRIFAIALVLAIAASLLIMPASAESLSDNLILNLDFSKESLSDQSGHCADPEFPAEEFRNGTVEFEDNEELGKKVAHFDNLTLKYELEDYNDVVNNFSLEVYFNLVNKQGSFGIIAGDYFYNTKSGFGIVVGKFVLEGDSVGYGKGISAVEGDGTQSITIEGAKDYSFQQWVHAVLVHENDKLRFYVNGELVGETDTVAPLPNDTLQGFRVGGYNLADQFQIEEMLMSYVRVYKTVLTGDEVKALYDARGAEAPDSSQQNPTQTPADDDPTQVPADDNPTEAPAKPTEAPAKPTAEPVNPNPQTFDPGLISLAAMALSSMVLAKKRKK